MWSPLSLKGSTGKLALLLDLYVSSILKAVGKNPVNFFLTSKDARSKSILKLAEKAYEAGHTIGYRTIKSNDKKFHDLAPEDLKAELKEAKKKFKELADVELEYVLLPKSKHSLKEQMEIIYNLGLIPVSATHEAKDSKANKAMSKKHAGYIVYQSADDKSVTSQLLKEAKKESLKLVSLDKCLDEEAGDEKAQKKKSSHKKQAKKGLIRVSDVEGLEQQQKQQKEKKKGHDDDSDADSADPDDVVNAGEKNKKDEEAEKLKKEAEALAAKQGKKNSATSSVGGSMVLLAASSIAAALLI